MKRLFPVALVVVGSLAVCLAGLHAQAPAAGNTAASGQNKPAGETPKPASAPQSSANPFPEDTNNVPVLPSKAAPPLPAGTYYGDDNPAIPLPGDDLDPVRSPDDPPPAAASAEGDSSSSSLAGLERLLPQPGDGQPEKKKKLLFKEPTHEEAASKDIEVGGFYLGTKDWKGALSRFESALVLDPENPDVYWGLAEAERHLGNFAGARANYLKVVDYDPDSRHGKDARKALKEPEIANAASPAPSQPAEGKPN